MTICKFDIVFLRIILTQSSKRRRTLDTSIQILLRRVDVYIPTQIRSRANTKENGRDTRVCSKQEHRKFVSILRGNPRNPTTNIPVHLSRSLFLSQINSIFLASPTGAPSTPFSRVSFLFAPLH